MEFLTSKEVLIVVIVAIIIFIIGAIYLIVEKILSSRKVAINIESVNQASASFLEQDEEMPVLDQIMVNTFNESPVNNSSIVMPQVMEVNGTINNSNNDIEGIYNDVKEEVSKKDELVYTEIKPNEIEAKEELRKVTEELIKQEERKNIDLTKFEEEQEENAIISMDELLQKSGVLYEKNEITQYLDEGNEPISLADLEKHMAQVRIEKEKMDLLEDQEMKKQKENVVPIPQVIEITKPQGSSINNSTKELYKDKVFKSSPIISPIFGIEKKEDSVSTMELENTANYEKLDEEIRKSNEFLTTLKELQKNLD